MTSSVAPWDEDVVLSPEWLTTILGSAVVAVSVAERLETVATKVRFLALLADGRKRALCAKGFFNPAMRRPHGMATEAAFYRDTAPELDVRVPPCVYSAVDDDTGHGLVIMEDLHASSHTFLDPMGSLTVDQAGATLEQLAALHARCWDEPRPGLRELVADLVAVMPARQLQVQLDDGRAAAVHPRFRDGERLVAAMKAIAALDGPRCMLHGDLHTGNLYTLPDGRPGFIDWQAVQYGSWAVDVSYHLATALDPADRRTAERALLEGYLAALRRLGVQAPDHHDAWWHYRAALPYGYFMWGITRLVERPTIDHLTGRLGTAVADHDSFGLLGV